MFEFENPPAFFLFLLIPVLYILRYIQIFSPLSLPLNLSDWNGSNFKWNGKTRKIISALSGVLWILFYVCIVFACADPVFHLQQKVYSSKGAAVVFVLDISPSMAAKDIGSISRLEAAKNSIVTMTNANSGSEFGLVVMAEDAAVLVPPTMDCSFFLSRLDSVNVGELGDGTAIGTGLSCAVYHLENSKAPKKSIVLITDGENNSGSVHPYTAARLAAGKGISLYVLGIGTRGVVPIDYIDPKSNKLYSGYLESKFDTSSIAKIASEGNGKFFEIESLSSLSQAVSSISRNETVAQSYYIKNQDVFYYQRFLIAAVIFACIAWSLRRLLLQEVL
ncbi:VWA domain-containing protein [Treponema sp.]|uniref:VWA domain-containing protein n=1 Tax=Treponema sp. TaxID=166 RepID=UPI003F0FE98B